MSPQGISDMLYTFLQVPIQGYFSPGSLAENHIWLSCYNLYQGMVGRQSMTCSDAGFQIGRVWQSFLAFKIQTTVLFN